MTKDIKVIPLGGLDEVGKNMTVFESGNEIIVVDVGTSFPDEDMYGVNTIVPNMEYLIKNKDKVKKLIITHGHEDHIGGVFYFLREFPEVELSATQLAMMLIKNKLKGSKVNLKKTNIIDKDSIVKTNEFSVSFFATNHSIPDTLGLVIKNSECTIVHTSDFKIDNSAQDGIQMDYGRITEIANEGVDLLLADSTNALKEGFSTPEKKIEANLLNRLSMHSGRIIATTFASSMYRLQSLINVAEKTNRKVVPIGKSMKNNLKLGIQLGHMTAKKGTIISDKQMADYADNEILVVTTGSQGEPTSALRRMVIGEVPAVKLKPSDLIVFSSNSIPGNEKTVFELMNDLAKKGVEIESGGHIHTSGHGYQEEIKMMISLFKPKHYMPVHGEFRMLRKNGQLANSIGVPKENIHLCFNGDVLRVSSKGVKKEGTIEKFGVVLMDQSGMGETSIDVLKDRKRMANHGVALVQIKKINNDVKTKVTLKGVVNNYERKILYKEINVVVKARMKEAGATPQSVRRNLYNEIGKVLDNHLKRKPLIVLSFD